MDSGKRILIIGKENSVFALQTARDFKNQNYHVMILGNDQTRKSLDDSIEVIRLEAFKQRRFIKVRNKLISLLIEPLDSWTFWIINLIKAKEYSAEQFKNTPSLKRSINYALYIREALRDVHVDVIYCHHIYFYGLCGILFKNTRKVIVHPWGSDIYKYPNTSLLRFYLISKIIAKADILLVGSLSARKFILSSYKIDEEKIHMVNYTIDRNFFSLPNPQDLKLSKDRLAIPNNRISVLSCRRFASGWGPEIIKSAFISAAQKRADLYFIILSGYDVNPLIDQFEAEVIELKLTDYFMFVKRHIDLSEYTQLCKVSEYAVSAMSNPDMRSSSILQAVACGCHPILSRQAEYENMVEEGFHYSAFDGSAADLLDLLINLEKPSDDIANSNSNYIDKLNETNYVNQINQLVDA